MPEISNIILQKNGTLLLESEIIFHINFLKTISLQRYS
jgi:hypothetical protein